MLDRLLALALRFVLATFALSLLAIDMNVMSHTLAAFILAVMTSVSE